MLKLFNTLTKKLEEFKPLKKVHMFEKYVGGSPANIAVGVTRQTIISLENGKYNASLQLAYRIARFFDRQIEQVFIFEEE